MKSEDIVDRLLELMAVLDEVPPTVEFSFSVELIEMSGFQKLVPHDVKIHEYVSPGKWFKAYLFTRLQMMAFIGNISCDNFREAGAEGMKFLNKVYKHATINKKA